MEESPSGKTRLYYSISEVSELLDVKQHVLRYWESQFPNLRPRKNRAGNRMYQPKDIDTLKAIKELLYDRRYTIAGARPRLLKPNEPIPETTGDEPEIEFLAPKHREALRGVREEVVSLRNWLIRLDREAETRRPSASSSRGAENEEHEIGVDESERPL